MSFRSQAAALPSNPLSKCAEAYGRGEMASGARLFDAAHAQALPWIVSECRSHFPSREDQEDAVQRAGLRLWECLKKGVIPDVKTLTRYACIDMHRKRQRFDTVPFDEAQDASSVDVEATVISKLDAAERTKRAEQRNPRHAAVLVLLGEGHSIQSTASEIGVSRDTIERDLVSMRSLFADRLGIHPRRDHFDASEPSSEQSVTMSVDARFGALFGVR